CGGPHHPARDIDRAPQGRGAVGTTWLVRSAPASERTRVAAPGPRSATTVASSCTTPAPDDGKPKSATRVERVPRIDNRRSHVAKKMGSTVSVSGASVETEEGPPR